MREVLIPAGRAAAWRIPVRLLVVLGLLVAACVGAGLLALCYGDGWSRPADVVAALTGSGPIDFVVSQWRLPRVVAGLAFGAALALSGAVFQNLTRNPLGTPDILGLSQGAYTGALLVLTLGYGALHRDLATGATGAEADAGGVGLAAGALAGALLTGAVVYLLAAGQGFTGLRLVVIGIGVNAVLGAVNAWIILRAEVDVALTATAWGAGSLNGTDWEDLGLPLIAVAVLVAVLALAARGMHQLALGDEIAATTGVERRRLRMVLLLVGIGLIGTVTAVCGPIVFVALAAPQIGRRLTGAAGVPLVPAALVGALLLVVSDVIAQALLAPITLPVGVVTTAVGGLYLIWLLTKEVR